MHGPAEALPFADCSFDLVFCDFGAMTFGDPLLVVPEVARVLRRGGRFFCLEFSTTTWPGFKEVYDGYSHKLVPKLGQLLAQDADSYRYLIESIRRFPDMPTFKGMIADAGFVRTKVEPIMGGLVAIHASSGDRDPLDPARHMFVLGAAGERVALGGRRQFVDVHSADPVGHHQAALEWGAASGENSQEVS